MAKSRIRVIRILVYEGSPEWVRETMAWSVCKPDTPIKIVTNTITEVERKEETINEDATGTHA